MGRLIDREKVIKGLHQHCECSLFDRCGECPYYETNYDSWGESKFKCRDALLDDALAMIDTQYKLILELQNLISIGTKMMNGDKALCQTE